MLADVDGTLETTCRSLDHVIKTVGVSDHDLVARAEAAAQSRFGAYVSAARSQPHYLDVTHPTANKGIVMERLSHHFKIPLDQIATFGDQANDVLMFRRGGMSVAVGNATEEVRRQATSVSGSNGEDGFANAIERYVLPRTVSAPVSEEAARATESA